MCGDTRVFNLIYPVSFVPGLCSSEPFTRVATAMLLTRLIRDYAFVLLLPLVIGSGNTQLC